MKKNFRKLMMVFLVVTLATPTAFSKSWWDKARAGENEEAEEPPKKPETKAPPASDESGTETEDAAGAKSVEDNSNEIPETLDGSAPVKPKKKKRKVRKTASVDGDSSETVTRRRDRTYNSVNLVRIWLLAGYSSTSFAGGAYNGGVLNSSLIVDVRLGYVGFDLDGYYDLGMGIKASDGSNASGTSFNQNGGLLDIKGEIPFMTGSLKWVPKLGVGYGIIGENQAGASGSVSQSAKVSASGPFAVVGFETQVMPWLFFNADYAHSIVASTTVSASLTDTTTPANNYNVSSSASGTSFQRIRAGAHAKFGGYNIGAEFVQRSLNNGTDTETLNAVMALMGLQF